MLKKWFDPQKKILKNAKQVADQVFALDEQMRKLSDDDIKQKTEQFKQRYKDGESLENLQVKA